MKKTILILAVALTTVTASAAELLEGIVVRVGDRIITRTQYERRLADIYADIERSSPPDQHADLRKAARETLVDELVFGLELRDRAQHTVEELSEGYMRD